MHTRHPVTVLVETSSSFSFVTTVIPPFFGIQWMGLTQGLSAIGYIIPKDGQIPGMSVVFQIIRKRFEFKICRRVFKRCFDLVIGVKDSFLKIIRSVPTPKIELLLFDSNYCIGSVKKRSFQDKGNFTVFFHFENNEIGTKGEFTNFNEHIFSYSNRALE
ncbi:hypothetical protein Tco_1493855 [Tanacetum coccineum]